MKTYGFFVVTLGLAFPAFAEDISQRLDADPDGEVFISNTSGSVDVRGWSRDLVEVTGTLGDDVEELIFERDGDEITIKVKTPSRMFGRSDVTSFLVVRIPGGSSVDVATVSADIDVRDVSGELELQSVSGDIASEVFESDVEMSTVSGEISASGDGKALEADMSSVSGNISLSNLGGELRAGSVSGRVQVSGGRFDSVDLETVNGGITFRGILEPDGELSAESVNGSVNIDFQNALEAHYEVESFNGSINNCFGIKAERTSRYAPGYELVHTVGDGGATVQIETLNGSIKVCSK